MTIISEIEKVTEGSFLFVLFDILFLISPGLLTIFYFHRDLFLSLDPIKLILLSIAITLPLLCWNIILLFQLLYRGKLIDSDEKKSFFFIVSVALLDTDISLCILLFISYLLGFSFKKALLLMVFVKVIYTICFILLDLLIKHLHNLASSLSHKGLGSCEVAQAADD